MRERPESQVVWWIPAKSIDGAPDTSVGVKWGEYHQPSLLDYNLAYFKTTYQRRLVQSVDVIIEAVDAVEADSKFYEGDFLRFLPTAEVVEDEYLDPPRFKRVKRIEEH